MMEETAKTALSFLYVLAMHFHNHSFPPMCVSEENVADIALDLIHEMESSDTFGPLVKPATLQDSEEENIVRSPPANVNQDDMSVIVHPPPAEIPQDDVPVVVHPPPANIRQDAVSVVVHPPPSHIPEDDVQVVAPPLPYLLMRLRWSAMLSRCLLPAGKRTAPGLHQP